MGNVTTAAGLTSGGGSSTRRGDFPPRITAAVVLVGNVYLHSISGNMKKQASLARRGAAGTQTALEKEKSSELYIYGSRIQTVM